MNLGEAPDGAVLYLPDGGRLERVDGRWENPRRCTGIAARWCPVHGDCACPGGDDANLDDHNCPLHSELSNHAEPPPPR